LKKKKKPPIGFPILKLFPFKTFTPTKCTRGGVLKLYFRIQYLKTCHYPTLYLRSIRVFEIINTKISAISANATH